MEEKVNSRCTLDDTAVLRSVCDALKKVDKGNAGLITADAFNTVLRDLGFQFGSQKLDHVLRFVSVLPDGYVVFKPLLLKMEPHRYRSQSDNMSEHFCPKVWKEDVYLPACPKSRFPQRWDGGETVQRLDEQQLQDDAFGKAASSEKTRTPTPSCLIALTPNRSSALRRLFSMWDRCLIGDDAFKFHISQVMRSRIPREAEWLIAQFGPSRTLSFGKLLQALRLDAPFCSPRRYRNQSTLFDSNAIYQPHSRFAHRQLFGEPILDPITWRPRHTTYDAKNSSKFCAGSPAEIAAYLVSKYAMTPTDANYKLLKQVSNEFALGRLGSVGFLSALVELGVTPSEEVKEIVRLNEASGSVPHRLLLQTVFRAKDLAQH